MQFHMMTRTGGRVTTTPIMAMIASVDIVIGIEVRLPCSIDGTGEKRTFTRFPFLNITQEKGSI